MIIDTMGKLLSWLVRDVHKLMIFAIYDLLFSLLHRCYTKIIPN